MLAVGCAGGDRWRCVHLGGVDAVIRVDLQKHPTMTERLLQRAVADYVQWWNVICVPNLCRWHEMDVAMLTRAGYLWEFEIKVSQQDWNGDHRKDEPTGSRPWQSARRDLRYVKRFHYVYPTGLVCPDWVPAWAGLIEAQYVTQGGRCYVALREERKAGDRKVEKVQPDDREAMLRSIYHRYWKMQPETLGP